MRAVLLRRMMVLGVCALGVSALYLVPGLIGTNTQIGVPAPAGQQPVVPAGPVPDRASTAARAPVQPSTSSTAEDLVRQGQEPAAEAPATDTVEPSAPASSSPTTASRTRGSVVDASRAADAEPPAAVTDLSVQSADAEEVEVSWAPSSDDGGEVSYRVWFNGYEVEQTTDTSTTLAWFNDDSQQQVVVVRAVDRTGNESRVAATLVLTRPEASPAPSTAPPSESPTEPGTDATEDPAAADQSPSAAPATPTTEPSTEPTTAEDDGSP